ncbi:TspO/MBR family-domain-containing protein [Microdochium trichocladiopsis]|uniref:TspO/MBR family-domain-containing protein n=1 Tax=Microdochium trichocladiopsis TaxID=1682393 RepID=A0A9P8YAZ7_9PEZI|nr:TspO/MBR family-domain-containing protein [Microdochium trichocladiopsis]KAH7034957.1 TspO/MBR family-domain-containing protein [Microdochium trichocladiopsis]
MTAFLSHLNMIPYQVFASPAASIVLPITLGMGVGFSTAQTTKSTYAQIRQPPLRPPAAVFGPVWTVLYGLMGYAAHRAYVATSGPLPTYLSQQDVRALYSLQLGLNLVWQPLFFGMRRPALALADILALVGVNGYLTYSLFQVDEVAGWCFVPYLAWLSFATYLNAAVGYLNEWDISDSTLAVRAVKDKRM